MSIVITNIILDGRTSWGLAATVPDSPTGATATAGNTQATVTFIAPASDGGSAITGYTVLSFPAGGTDTNAGTTDLSHVVTGLTNGVSYTFQVYATNALGNSANSASSNAVTPINSDPYWSNVAILLTGESPTATPIATFSKTPLSVTYQSSNTENSATQFKFGTKSVWKKDATAVLSWTDDVSYGGNTGPIRSTFATSSYPATVTSPFTIETFFRSTTRPNQLFSTVLPSTDTTGGWALTQRFDSGNWGLSIINYSTGGGSTTFNLGVYDYGGALNTWVNFALTFDGTTAYMFVNGQLIGTRTGTINKTGGTWTGFRIGSGTASSYWDETRLTAGVCRYTSNYTVATEPYPQV